MDKQNVLCYNVRGHNESGAYEPEEDFEENTVKKKSRAMIKEHEIILYQIDKTNICVNVFFGEETFWMTQKAMAELFDCSTDNISLHLKNIYREEELDEESTTEFFSIVQKEGNRNVSRNVKCYNLDSIIAVGYRVNSKKATRFRQWAMFEQTNQFLMNNRRKVLSGKGKISHETALEKAEKEYEMFRIKQDKEYISEFDREMERYLKGE